MNRTGQMVTHDPVRGLSYIYLVGKIPPGGAKNQLIASPDIILDFNADGQLIGIELLREHLLHPSLTAIAVPPGTEDGVVTMEMFHVADQARTEFLRDVDPNDQIGALWAALRAAMLTK